MLTGNDGGTDKIAIDEKAEKIVDDEEESDEFDDKMDRELDKEEKEMNDGDSDDEDEDSEKLLQDAKILEEAMEEELERVAKKVKPVRQALYKVLLYLFFFPLFLFPSCPLTFSFLFIICLIVHLIVHISFSSPLFLFPSCPPHFLFFIYYLFNCLSNCSFFFSFHLTTY